MVATLALLMATSTLAPTFESGPAANNLHERDGRWPEACVDLKPAADRFPQDYHLQIRTGWSCLRSGDYPAAEHAFRRAANLSGASSESLDGLFALRNSRLSGSSWMSVSGRTDGTLGFAAGLTLGLNAPVTGTVVYRLLNLESELVQPIFVPLPTQEVTSRQHEVHLAAGMRLSSLTVNAHYAYLDVAGSPVHIGGASMRPTSWGPFGLLLETSISAYSDMTVTQFLGECQLPSIGGFSIIPGGALQIADDRVYGGGRLRLHYSSEWGSIELGGRGGFEQRPVSLSWSTVSNFPEAIEAGAWATAQYNLANRLSLFTSFDFSLTESVQYHVFTAGVIHRY